MMLKQKLLLGALALSQRVWGSTPSVAVKNGTFIGKYVASYDQDLFLGIPFAQPPVGQLRYQNPQRLNTSFDIREATEYADSCVGYGNSPAWPHTLGEDCLTLNIIRPAIPDINPNQTELLPVGVFLHGGGWSMDYSANGVYNLSFIVNESVNMGKPFIAVSADYRLSLWGFLASQDILDAGVANLGLKDQHLALKWIQENIEAFGGNPSKVTIWGESAGGGNVGYLSTAYGGRDDGLFRAIIAESGADGSHMKNLTKPQQNYDIIVNAVGCEGQVDKLGCLRTVPFDQLNATISQISNSFYPVVDGDLIADYPSVMLRDGAFTRTPILLGTNADEGTMFGGTSADTDDDIRRILHASGIDDVSIDTLMTLYPNIDSLGLPAHYRVPFNGTVKSQFKRAVALQTDQTFLSWRRQRTEAWSNYGVPAYSYFFESPTNLESYMGTSHFLEIGYVFYNTIGLGYADGQSPLQPNSPKEILDLAKINTRMWISFINDLDPNNHGIDGIEKWPTYDAKGGYGQNFYLHPTAFGVKPDTFRLAGTAFINSIAESQYGR